MKRPSSMRRIDDDTIVLLPAADDNDFGVDPTAY
jgi:hypothetical protein